MFLSKTLSPSRMNATKVCKAITTMTPSTALMPLIRIAQAGIAHPFGDERTVTQAFPSGINEHDADPFLMCDFFDSVERNGPAAEGEYPVDWHPHRGFDICSYLKSGKGRHADSLGNRETYETPGMQWMSTGSGVYHAEGGANEKGSRVTGFQIWINVPAHQKMMDPKYGTVPPKDLPTIKEEGSVVRVMAGKAFGATGPFETVQDVEMLDMELHRQTEQSTSKIGVDIETGLDTAMLYAYKGGPVELSLPNGEKRELASGSIALLDASSDDVRGIEISADVQSDEPACVMLFAGKKLQQPIAWHGPIVMNTQTEIRQALSELRTGRFPPKRVDWDYMSAAGEPN